MDSYKAQRIVCVLWGVVMPLHVLQPSRVSAFGIEWTGPSLAGWLSAKDMSHWLEYGRATFQCKLSLLLGVYNMLQPGM